MCTAGCEHLAASEFREWLSAAAPGAWCIYAVGSLAVSIGAAWSAKDPNAHQLSSLQEAAWKAGDKGYCCLVQRKLKPGKYEYIAIRNDEGIQSRFDDGNVLPEVVA